jgi:hypothetical protein
MWIKKVFSFFFSSNYVDSGSGKDNKTGRSLKHCKITYHRKRRRKIQAFFPPPKMDLEIKACSNKLPYCPYSKNNICDKPPWRANVLSYLSVLSQLKFLWEIHFCMIKHYDRWKWTCKIGYSLVILECSAFALYAQGRVHFPPRANFR